MKHFQALALYTYGYGFKLLLIAIMNYFDSRVRSSSDNFYDSSPEICTTISR